MTKNKLHLKKKYQQIVYDLLIWYSFRSNEKKQSKSNLPMDIKIDTTNKNNENEQSTGLLSDTKTKEEEEEK